MAEDTLDNLGAAQAWRQLSGAVPAQLGPDPTSYWVCMFNQTLPLPCSNRVCIFKSSCSLCLELLMRQSLAAESIQLVLLPHVEHTTKCTMWSYGTHDVLLLS